MKNAGEKFKNMKTWQKVAAIVIVVVILGGIIGALGGARKVTAPDVVGMGLNDAEKALIDAGFSQQNIKSEREDGKMILNKDGKIVSSQDPTPGSECTGSTQVKLMIKTTKQDAEEEAKTIIEPLLEKNCKEAVAQLENAGWTVKTTLQKTGYEYSAEDREELDLLTTGYTVSDAEKKEVTLYVNTQFNIDAEKQQDEISRVLSEKLDRETALDAVRAYGKKAYPYGFKLRTTGTTTTTTSAQDENTWFIKGSCNITNENKAKAKDLTFECKVTGTNENPVVSDFMVY